MRVYARLFVYFRVCACVGTSERVNIHARTCGERVCVNACGSILWGGSERLAEVSCAVSCVYVRFLLRRISGRNVITVEKLMACSS